MADVDVEMIPLVNWLNSYQSVWTHFCCQGEPRKDGETDESYSLNQPYVLFTCIDPVDLISVLSILHPYSITQIIWNNTKSQLEYCTRFYCQRSLFDTIEYIQHKEDKIMKRMVHGEDDAAGIIIPD